MGLHRLYLFWRQALLGLDIARTQWPGCAFSATGHCCLNVLIIWVQPEIQVRRGKARLITPRRRSSSLLPDKSRASLTREFFNLAESLLNSTCNLFRATLGFEVAVFRLFPQLLPGCAPLFMKCAFDLLTCAVRHCFQEIRRSLPSPHANR